MRLRKSCPQFFDLPMVRRTEFRHVRRLEGAHRPVVAPLTGEDLYLTKEDFDSYAKAAVAFWEWLATEFEALRLPVT